MLENIDWIHQSMKKVQDPRLGHPDLGLQLPKNLHLKLEDTNFNIVKSCNHRVIETPGNLAIPRGEIEKLNTWLTNKAKMVFAPKLEDLANEMGVSFSKLSVRNQKSRWGSCSSKKTISLNRNLLFCEPHLVRYIMIHELSHLTHPNHSANFWNHVARFDKNYKENDKAMNQASKDIPLWALPK